MVRFVATDPEPVWYLREFLAVLFPLFISLSLSPFFSLLGEEIEAALLEGIPGGWDFKTLPNKSVFPIVWEWNPLGWG